MLANSMPKSGTHLLEQIVDALPRRRNYGRFLESMTASYVFRERSEKSTCRFLASLVSGETTRAHLHHHALFGEEITRRGTVHYFIYRDLRDVVVSEVHYLRSVTWWHRLHPSFRACATFGDALMLAIEGLDPETSDLDYPDVGARFRRFLPWLDSPDVHAVRYEDLRSEARSRVLREMVRFYADRARDPFSIPEVVARTEKAIDPDRSHTYRRGLQGEWKEVFSRRHAEAFSRLAGDLQDALDLRSSQ